MRHLKLLPSLLFAAMLTAQTAQFPSSVADDADLLVARNNAQSTLGGNINDSVTTFTVAGTSSFISNMVVVIGSEQIFCTTFAGTTFSGCTRGFDSTAAASHTLGDNVSGYLVAWHHNQLAAELKAIEQSLIGTSYIGDDLRFGCATSSCAKWKRAGTKFEAWLADGSALTRVDASQWGINTNGLLSYSASDVAVRLNGSAGEGLLLETIAAATAGDFKIETDGVLRLSIDGESGAISVPTDASITFVSAGSTAPAKVGTTVPATCTPGDQFFESDATAGQNIWLCTATDTYTQLTGGGGDVVGPAGATDHAIARFDTATGKLLQDTAATIDDSGLITEGIGVTTGFTKVLGNPGDTGASSYTVNDGSTAATPGYFRAISDGGEDVHVYPCGGDDGHLCSSGSTPAAEATGYHLTQENNSCTDAGGDDTYACNVSPAITAYVNPHEYKVCVATANTGAATLNLNGVGAKAIKWRHDQVLTDGIIEANQCFKVVYNSNDDVFELQSPASKPVPVDVELVAVDFTIDTSTGDGKFYFVVPAKVNGWNLTAISAQVITKGTTDLLNVDIARCAVVAADSACTGTVDDMLSTNLTIDTGEGKSSTAATPAVIDGTKDDVATDQIIRVDIDAVHSGTAAKGLIAVLRFEEP